MSDHSLVAMQPVKHAELGMEITVGAETARRLTKILGRHVSEGEVFDITLASTDPDAVHPHVFSDPRLNADLYPDF